ncbi:hypothetical protein WANA13_0910 [Wolbachia endosymbiont of Drosophila ananassae]|nr:hypothetical protein WANA13_0910 [Wolbachia endosymbiont of Drosophila ananassae]
MTPIFIFISKLGSTPSFAITQLVLNKKAIKKMASFIKLF